MEASGDEQSRRGEEGMDIKQNTQVPRVGIGFVINGIMDDRHLTPREGMDDTGTWGVYEIHNDIKQIQVPRSMKFINPPLAPCFYLYFMDSSVWLTFREVELFFCRSEIGGALPNRARVRYATIAEDVFILSFLGSVESLLPQT
jgi:hypothetical protein